MQTRLSELRNRLSHLRQRRAAVRWGSAICALLAAAIWLLMAVFLCDWSVNLSLAARTAVVIGWSLTVAWMMFRFAWPLIRQRESAEDVALLVEQHHKIDSDLVAALQFESPAARTWGSARLSTAVVDYVSEFSPSLDVFAGFSYQPLPRRAWQLLLTLLVVCSISLAFPSHVAAFWNRFLLGSSHYPTKTQIRFIRVNGAELPVFDDGKTRRVFVPLGHPVKFEVAAGGVIPPKGFASLTGQQNNLHTQLDLNPRSEESADFAGEMSHATDSFRVRFQLGDAVSDPADVEIVPRPLVDIRWDITPPAYARKSFQPGEQDGTSRQLSVLEGSSASLNVTCANKRLQTVELHAGGQVIRLSPAGSNPQGGGVWHMPSAPPFAQIHEPIKYELKVADQDGLSPATQIIGQIRLKTDRQPRIVNTAVTRQVLPTATPKIDYMAVDDFGIAKITAQITVMREDGRSSQHEITVQPTNPTDEPAKSLRGQVAIPLSSFELSKGDEVKVVLDVTDDRGELAGQKSSGELISFSVTDLNGILAQTGEEDKKTAKELDEILRRELGIGGEKK